MHFVALWAVVAFTIMGGNLLYIVFLHLLASLFLVLAAFSVKSIFSHLGANRELLTMIAYEPVLVMLSVAFYIQNGSFSIEAVRANPSALGSLFFLFLAFLFGRAAQTQKIPL